MSISDAPYAERTAPYAMLGMMVLMRKAVERWTKITTLALSLGARASRLFSLIAGAQRKFFTTQM
jgi:hypothetical protein